MLTKHHRFHGHGSLRYVYKNGQTARARQITLKYVKNSRRQHSRGTVVVSKKVLKLAVGRNRIRRRLYEILRHELAHFNDVYDVVLLVFSAEVAFMPSQELEAIVKKQLKEAGITK